MGFLQLARFLAAYDVRKEIQRRLTTGVVGHYSYQ